MLMIALATFNKFYQHRVWHYKEATASNEKGAEALYFDQYVDHFDNQNQDVFRQKYYVNDTYFQSGGPMVLFLGGEGPLGDYSVGNSYSNDYFARELHGLKVALEHRFYGESFPAADSSNLTLLSSKQAIADVSMFIPFIKSKFNISKVLVVGGSYAGNLAAWIRAQLPHMVDAALASSAPVVARADFAEYFQHVEEQLKIYGGEECVGAINMVSRYIDARIPDPDAWAELAEVFNCDLAEMQSYNELDWKMWAQNIGTAIAGVVQYAAAENFDGKEAENDITTVCRAIAQNYSESADPKVVAHDYAYAMGMLQHVNTGMGYSTLIDALRNTDLQTDESLRSWYWQTCTEFGYYQTTTLPGTIFTTYNDLDSMLHMCQDAYFVDFMQKTDAEHIRQVVEDACDESNIWYGARNIPRDQIYYSHGTVDPWSELGVNDKLSWDDGQFFTGELAMIQEGSHCTDLYTNWTLLDDLRLQELQSFKKWLGFE